MTLFLKGLAFGFILAATVGPMWVLCFRRSIAQGALAGFVSGMGIAVADGLYGAVAAFGLTAVSGFLLDHQLWIGHGLMTDPVGRPEQGQRGSCSVRVQPRIAVSGVRSS